MITRTIPEILSGVHGIHIFVHAVSSVGELPGINLNDRESHRALVLARADDIVVVPSPVDKDFLDYCNSLGFKVDSNRIVVVAGSTDVPLTERLLADTSAQEQLASLVDNGTIWLDPFAVCDREVQLISRLSESLGHLVRLLGAPPEVTKIVNRKDTARKRAIDMNVPVTPGEFVEALGTNIQSDLHRIADAIRRQMAKSQTGSVLIKGAVGDSGSAIFIVTKESDIDEVLHTIAMRGDNYPYHVETFFELTCSPNIVLWIDSENGEISLVSVSDQRLSKNMVFAGSIFPSRTQLLPEIIELAETLANCLYSEGYYGWAGFDCGEFNDSTTLKPQLFFSEINARYNGGLYAKAVFDTLQKSQQENGYPQPGAYVTENTISSPIDFAGLRVLLEGLLFDPKTGRGVFPYNPGRLQDGKITVTCLGDNLDDAWQLADAFRQRF